MAHGLVCYVGTTIITSCGQLFETGNLQWMLTVKVSIGAAITYLLKQLFTNEEGQLFIGNKKQVDS